MDDSPGKGPVRTITLSYPLSLLMKLRHLTLALLVPWLHIPAFAQTAEAEVKNLKVDGGIEDGKLGS